jgi:alpha-mannosidase
VEEAYALNVPLDVREMKPQSGPLPSSHSFFEVSRAGVMIEAIKVAQEGDALIVRLFECEGARGPVTLRTTLPVRKAWLTDLLEKEIAALPLKAGSVSFALKPFEIRTIKFAIDKRG